MKKSINELDNHTTIPTIQTRFKDLARLPGNTVRWAIGEVFQRITQLLSDDATRTKSDEKLKEKIEKLPKFTGKKSKK